nr:uncharacterized protein LOC109167532 [Ipomoea batatas]
MVAKNDEVPGSKTTKEMFIFINTKIAGLDYNFVLAKGYETRNRMVQINVIAMCFPAEVWLDGHTFG